MSDIGISDVDEKRNAERVEVEARNSGKVKGGPRKAVRKSG